MENSTTVRIDLQRLQILNDRLCQTLEALNQVRISAHAPGMNAGVNPGVPSWNPGMSYGFNYGYPQQQQQQQFWGMPVNPMFGAGYPAANYGWGMTPSHVGFGGHFTGINSFNGINNNPMMGYNNGYATTPSMARGTTGFVQPTFW